MGIMKRLRNIGINGTTSPSYRPLIVDYRKTHGRWGDRQCLERAGYIADRQPGVGERFLIFFSTSSSVIG
jgi:hypothetical protein